MNYKFKVEKRKGAFGSHKSNLSEFNHFKEAHQYYTKSIEESMPNENEPITIEMWINVSCDITPIITREVVINLYETLIWKERNTRHTRETARGVM